MKRSLVLSLGLPLIAALWARADEVLPPRFNFNRYSGMVDHSPFAIATAVALPETTPDFAKDLFVANAAHLLGGDMVTIMSSSDQNFKKYLTTKEPTDGYSIASIEWSDRVGATKVTISKDGKSVTLTFNQALLSQAAPHGLPNAGEMRPSVPLMRVPGGDRASRPDMRPAIKEEPKVIAPSAPNPIADFEPLQVPNPQQQQQWEERKGADRKRKTESYPR